MAAGDEYRIKADESHARARNDSNEMTRRQYESLASRYSRLAEQADWNERVEAVYDLCRQVRADAKSNRGSYESPRPRSAMQTERNSSVASIKEKTGRMLTRADLSEIARGIPVAVILLAMTTIAVMVFW